MSKNIKSEPVNQQSESTTPSVKNEPNESQTSKAGQTAAKRSFVPNLNVRRVDKDGAETASKSESTSGKQSQRKPFVPNLSNRGRNQRGSNLIQTHSVFEAGPAESTKRYGNNQNAESYSKVVGPSGLSATTSTSSTSSSKQVKSETDNYVKEEHSLLIDDTSKEDLEKAAYVNLKFETKEQLNENEIEIKRNELDTQLTNLFTKNESNENLILLQMPENLNLNELTEGHIGKIKVYKSGKVELCLNEDKCLNVNLSVAGSFLQEATALELSNCEQIEKSLSNKITNLGRIETKLVCSPIL